MDVSPINLRKKRSTTLALWTAFRAGRTNNNLPKRPAGDGRWFRTMFDTSCECWTLDDEQYSCSITCVWSCKISIVKLSWSPTVSNEEKNLIIYLLIKKKMYTYSIPGLKRTKAFRQANSVWSSRNRWMRPITWCKCRRPSSRSSWRSLVISGQLLTVFTTKIMKIANVIY